MDRAIDVNKQGTELLGKGKNYLLAIGINAYKHHPKLNNAVADAEAFGTVLTKRYGFEHLIEPLTDNLATQEAIFDALHHCGKLKTEDRLVIFFSGFARRLVGRRRTALPFG